MKRKFNVFKFIIFLICVILFFGLILAMTFIFMLRPTGNKNETVKLNVETGSTYYSLIDELKEEDLIKSELVFKIYLKFRSPKNLDAGVYNLNKGMSVSELIDALEERNTNNPDAVVVTIPEGKRIEEIAEIMSKTINKTKEELLLTWNNSEFIDEVISKYWFITEDVKKEGIRYSLEGYFFPSTYELQNKEVSEKDVAYTLLDQMEKELEEYKEVLENSNYTIHELLTMASIVEYEAILDEDRPIIAGVFYNRLNDGMKLQSCATVGYAIGEWKLSYDETDLLVDSVYNTYYYSGFPIGPANAPSKKSIEAAIYPEDTIYYYFLADVCSENPKTYFSETLSEHNRKASEYLTCL